MKDFVETILDFELADDVSGLLSYVQNAGQTADQLIYSTYRLLLDGRYRPAYILAMMVMNAGYHNPTSSLALSIGGLLNQNPEEELRGLKSLLALSKTARPEQKQVFFSDVVSPVMSLLLKDLLEDWDHNQVFRLGEILRAAVPEFREVFDWHLQPPPLTLEDILKKGRGKAALVQLSSPPPGMPRKPRRAVIAVREKFFPHRSWARLFDGGPRLQAAMSAYGWQTAFYGMKFDDLSEDYLNVIALCKRHQADILILDDDLCLTHENTLIGRSIVIQRLRQDLPKMKIMSFLFDTWSIDPKTLQATGALLDGIWDVTSPSLPLWNDPALAGKVLHAPLPHAGNFYSPSLPLGSRLSFSGSISRFNWQRALWLSGCRVFGVPVEQKISKHRSDGLSALDSYRAYMQELAQAPCSLNFSMRKDRSRIVTGRSFEVILAGSLLVQESTPDMHSYFISGEHFLEFSTFSELMAVVRFISENREAVESIRRQGYAFARTMYDDEKIIGYLDNLMFSDIASCPRVI